MLIAPCSRNRADCLRTRKISRNWTGELGRQRIVGLRASCRLKLPVIQGWIGTTGSDPNLPSDFDPFWLLRGVVPNGENSSLILRRCVVPYSWTVTGMHSCRRFECERRAFRWNSVGRAAKLQTIAGKLHFYAGVPFLRLV